MIRALVAGWFSFEQMGATAGDLVARDVVCDWLDELGVAYDVAVAPPFTDGVDWREQPGDAYACVIFVCGPFGNGWPVTDMLEHFNKARWIGLDLTMLQSPAEWNPFHLLLERDSDVACRPDLVFAAPQRRVPVVGVILAHRQKEYGRLGMHDQANAAIQQLLDSHEVAAVPIDTRLDENAAGLRTAAEVESLIARMDAIVTTRLHGTVFALKNGVPALAIDPVAGGAKVLRQTQAIGWPIVLTADALDSAQLEQTFARCLTEEARASACQCSQAAAKALDDVRQIFTQQMETFARQADTVR